MDHDGFEGKERTMNVSFIIPAYNEEKRIRRCLASIIQESSLYKIKNQYFNYEILVVDNNSTDATKEIVASEFPNVRLFLDTEKGVTRARQTGYLNAKYEIQAYIDADNILGNNWLKNLEILENNNNIIGLSGSLDFYENNDLFRLCGFIFFYIQSFFHQFLPTIQGGNYVVRKSALKKIGGHSVDFDFYGEDTDLAKRLSTVGKIKFMPKMKVYSSNRRFKNEGILKTMYYYIMSYIYVNIFNKPFSKEYKDYR